jgi:tetratricopeptide (TPR) repeat protein
MPTTPADRSSAPARLPLWRRFWFAVAAVAAVALAVRLAALPALARQELVFAKYPTLALEMAQGRGEALTAFTASPLYLYFWVLMHRLFPGMIGLVIPVQMVLGAITCAGIAMAGSCWAGRRAGLLAGLAAALYLPFVVNDASFVSEGLVLLCNTAALYCLGRLQASPRQGWALAAGAAIGVSGMARPNIALFIPFAMAAAWYTVPAGRRRLGLCLSVLVAAVAGPLLITVRNLVVSGQPVPVMSDSGIVLYLGNNELDTGLSYTWPRHEPLLHPKPGEVDPTHRVAREIAERESEKPLGPNEVADFWTRQALRYVLARPVEYAGLLLRKLRYTWTDLEIHDVQTTFAQEDRLRAWPLLRFGWVAPLALAGLALSASGWRRLFPLYGLLATYTATGMIFTVVARYRLPMLPALFVLAAVALNALADDLRRRRWQRAAGMVLLIVVAAVGVNLGDYQTRSFVASQRAAITTLNRAGARIQAGDLDKARALYEEITLSPPCFTALLQARYGLMMTALRAGDEQAAAAWRDAALGARLPQPDLEAVPQTATLGQRLTTDPEDVEALLLLGVRQWHEGQIDAAEHSFRQATRRVPLFPTGHLNRAWCLLRLGRPDQARRWAEAARRLQPELADMHRLIIEIARAQGRLPDLLPEYERLARIHPDISAYRDALDQVRVILAASRGSTGDGGQP